jgi:hypothetical protein
VRSIPTSVLIGLALVSIAVAGERVTVKVIARNDSNVPYSYAFANGSYGLAQNLNLRGATFTLVLPNGDSAVVNCTSKFQERFAGPGNVRSCRVPLVDEFEATFDGDKAKLFWPTSLDGKKVESETYKIIAVSKAAHVSPLASSPVASNDQKTTTVEKSRPDPLSPTPSNKPSGLQQVTQPAVPSTAGMVLATSDVRSSKGTVSLTSDPEGADIFVDSVGEGRTPALLKIAPGKHSIQIVSAGYKDWTSNVDVREGSIVNVTAALSK